MELLRQLTECSKNIISDQSVACYHGNLQIVLKNVN